MKRIVYFLAMSVVIAACESKHDYKAIRKEAIEVHDKVMAKNSQLVKNQMRLDTIARNLDSLKTVHPELDTLAEKNTIRGLLESLNNAEDKMSTWMREFNVDPAGKSDEAAVEYFRTEKLRIDKVDSLYQVAIEKADSYLLQF